MRIAGLAGVFLTTLAAGADSLPAAAQPPEERAYVFDLSNATYAELIGEFARQTGLGVIGQPPAGGVVDLVTAGELSFDQALAQVRMLLFNSEPADPHWLVRHDTHLEVIPVSDVLQVLPDNRMFRSAEAFQAAELGEDELVIVVYNPNSGSISELALIRDFMPDYVRITPLEDQNAVAIFALATDVEKYLGLVDFFADSGDDPRTLEVIEVNHIPPSEAMQRLQALMDLEGVSDKSVSRRRRRARAARRAISARRSATREAFPEPEVSLLADDSSGVLVVRAMVDKIEEIKLLLPYIDVESSSGFDPVVIPVEQAEAADVMATIEAVLAASEGSSAKSGTKKRRSAVRRSRRSRRARRSRRSKTSSTITVSNLTMMVHPSDNAIVVMADDEDLGRIRQLVELFDVTDRVGPIRIDLEHGDAARISASLMELLGQPRGGRSLSGELAIVADASDEAIWFEGTEQELTMVRELVATMDQAEDAVSLHIAKLRNQKPSLVAAILGEYDDNPTAKRSTARSRRRRVSPRRSRRRRSTRRPTRSRTVAVSKFTPRDEQNRLYVLCTDEEWAEYTAIIEQLENAAEEEESAVRLSLTNLDPQTAIDKLVSLFGDGDGRVRFAAAENDVLVMGASPSQIQSFKAALAEVDEETEWGERTFDLEYAACSEMMSTIRTLVGGDALTASRRGRRRRSAARHRRSQNTARMTELTIACMGNQLVVKAAPSKMEEVADLIHQFDVPQQDTELRTYGDFPPGTDIEEIAESLSSAVNGTPARSRGRRARRRVTPNRARAEFIAQPAEGKLVIRAESARFPEIEALLEVLRGEENIHELEIVYVEVAFADPEKLVEAVDPILALKVNELLATGELEDEPIRPQQRRRVRRGRRGRNTAANPYYLLAADARNERVVIASRPIVIDVAEELIAALDQPGVEPDRVEVFFLPVQFADPEELVAVIDPLLEIKVRELIAAGELSEKRTEPAPRTKRRPRRGRRPGRPRLQRKGSPSPHYHLNADARNARIVVAAPRSIITEATELVTEFDQPNDAGEVVTETVELKHADPQAMVKSIGQLKGISARRRPRRRARARMSRSTAASSERFSILVAPGGGAVVVRGLAEEVAETLEWIDHLDALSSAGRAIKVYEIEHVDLIRLGDLIMHTIDPPTRRRVRRPPRRPRPIGAEMPVDADEFALQKTWAGADVYIQADLIDKTLVVSASEQHLRRIDDIVTQLDTDSEADALTDPAVPSRLYELEHVDAFDAAFELEMVLEAFWEPVDVLPVVDIAPFGNSLIVRYPKEERFPEIEQLIQEHVDKPAPESDQVTRRALAVPRGMTPEEFAERLQQSHPELNIELENISADDDYGVREVQPQTRSQP